MPNTSRSIGILSILLIAVVFALTSSCSISSSTSPAIDNVHDGNRLEANLLELTREPTPPGVDDELFDLLKTELARVLTELDRSAAVAPHGSYNAVSDLALLGNDAAGWRLEWTVRNRGDYDRNGEVNASDMVPIAFYYLANTTDGNWISAKLADGDNNGEVNASDITPIGQNYAAFISGYRILGADSVDGAREHVAEIEPPPSPEIGSWLVSYDLPARDYEYYFVEPLDTAGATGESSWGSQPWTDPAQVNLGSDVIEVTQVFGAGGGTLSGPVGTPVEGISIEFPQNSLGSDVEIGIGHNDGNVIPADGFFRSPIIEIDDGGHGLFLSPVTISVPISAEPGLVPVMYNVNEDGSLSAMRFAEIDYAAQTASFSTVHASNKVIIDARYDFDSLAEISGRDTGFKPGLDGFQIKNYGSSIHRSGECLGIAGFAMWYFNTKKFNSHGRLFSSFMEKQGRQWWAPNGPPLYVQDHIATRAHTSLMIPFLKLYADKDAEKRRKPDPEHFGMIRGALLETKQPILLGLFSEEISLGHSTLCYSFGPAPEVLGDLGILLKMYDPAFPGEERTFSYVFDQTNPDYGDGSFTPYQGYADVSYVKFAVDGYGSLEVNEPFDSILADAQRAPPFSGEDKTVVNILSHKQGQVVTEATQEIQIEILDAQMLSEEMTVYVHPFYLAHDIRAVDEFINKHSTYDVASPAAINVDLFPGMNEINIGLLGKNSNDHWTTINFSFHGEGWGPADTGSFFLELPPRPVELEITSHTEGEILLTEDTVLSGTIDSPDVDVSEVLLFRDGKEIGGIKAPIIARNGLRDALVSFSFPVTLYEGANSFEVRTYAQYAQMEVTDERIDNNLPGGLFTLNLQTDPTPGTIYVTATDSVTGEEIETLRAKTVNTGAHQIVGSHFTGNRRRFADLAPGNYYIYIYSPGYHFQLVQALLPPGQEITVPVTLVPGPSASTLEVSFSYTRTPEYPEKPVWPECEFYHPVTGDKWKIDYANPGSLSALPYVLLSGEQEDLFKTLTISEILQPEPGDEYNFKYRLAIDETGIGHPDDGWFKVSLDGIPVLNIYLTSGLKWYNVYEIVDFYPGTGELNFIDRVGEYQQLKNPTG